MKNNFRIRRVVISGVNLVNGGPFTILHDAVKEFLLHYPDKYELYVLVNNRSLFSDLESSDIIFKEYAYPKKSWFLRIWFEYVHCYFISLNLKADVWIALHDMTPTVKAARQVVYCHNPSIFYTPTKRDISFEKSLFLQNKFYSFFYQFNIQRNDFVIVQQEWIRKEFAHRYEVKNVIVAYPQKTADNKFPRCGNDKGTENILNNCVRFFYPAFPRVFKNFEVLLETAIQLEQKGLQFELLLTIDGSENDYSSYIVKKYKSLKNVRFLGLLPLSKVHELYLEVQYLVFPSKLETWGLPISEAKEYDLGIIAANKEYAYETVGNYNKAVFFNSTSPAELSHIMQEAISGEK